MNNSSSIPFKFFKVLSQEWAKSWKLSLQRASLNCKLSLQIYPFPSLQRARKCSHLEKWPKQEKSLNYRSRRNPDELSDSNLFCFLQARSHFSQATKKCLRCSVCCFELIIIIALIYSERTMSLGWAEYFMGIIHKLIFIAILWNRYHYHPHIMDEKLKERCLNVFLVVSGEPELEPRAIDCRAFIYFLFYYFFLWYAGL